MGGWGFGVGGGVGVGFGEGWRGDRLTRSSGVFCGMRFGVWRGNQGVRDCDGLRVWELRGSATRFLLGFGQILWKSRVGRVRLSRHPGTPAPQAVPAPRHLSRHRPGTPGTRLSRHPAPRHPGTRCARM
jgi:hypothetical protein